MRADVRRPWTRDELILAINFYCKTTFGRMHSRNPEIIGLARRLGRTPGAVSYKLANFSSLDPTLDRKGAANVSRLDREVWDEFFTDWDRMFAESELRMAEFLAQGEDDGTSDVLGDLADAETARIAPSEIRTKQGVFRRLVLSAYHSTCCITGLSCPALLVASHIVPWSEDTRNRLNPMNGICLNALHDKAFDKGYISLDQEYRVMVCGGMDHELLARYRGRRITLPRRFLPSQEFLSLHRERIFLGA